MANEELFDELRSRILQLQAENERLRRWDAQLRKWLFDHLVEVGRIDLDADLSTEQPINLAERRRMLVDE